MNQKHREVLRFIAAPLLQYYYLNRRILPWREDPTPYHVWLSEIMLQQTRVEAVKGYYARFLAKLPDIDSLAMAEEEELLKLWEGLGYYNRVRNMHKAAVILREQFESQMPPDYEQIRELPGIGSYTAGAISSIAFGIPKPAVDGNVLRIVTRLLLDERDIMQASVRKEFEEELEVCMDQEHPGDFNQAMMDLGATVCVPNGEPRCTECPLSFCCGAYAGQCTSAYPVKKKPNARRIEQKTILIIKDETRAAIQKRDNKGLLAGMYEFPSMNGHVSPDEVLYYLKQIGLSAIRIEPLADSKHIFSHIEWHMKGYLVHVDEFIHCTDVKDLLFVEPLEIQDRYPIPTAYRAYRKAFLERTV